MRNPYINQRLSTMTSSPDSIMDYVYQFFGSFKEYTIPVIIGLGFIVWKLLRWIGVGLIDDLDMLKKKSSTYATKAELEDCHKDVAKRIDDQFERMHSELRNVHGRVDDIHKTILVNRVSEWKKNND